jgi:isochorismate pyruvate lyase
MTTPLKPEDCVTMAEVRDAIDTLDSEIVGLIGQRFRYIEAAARIKDHRDSIRDDARKAQVIDHAAHVARQHAVPDGLIPEIYERLIETSIAHELDCFDRARGGNEAL